MKAYFEGDKDVFVFKPIPKSKKGRPKKDVTDINVWDKTNADHIRSMTDEELARFLAEAVNGCMRHTEVCEVDDTCNGCFMEWLKQPYKEGDA